MTRPVACAACHKYPHEPRCAIGHAERATYNYRIEVLPAVVLVRSMAASMYVARYYGPDAFERARKAYPNATCLQPASHVQFEALRQEERRR